MITGRVSCASCLPTDGTATILGDPSMRQVSGLILMESLLLRMGRHIECAVEIEARVYKQIRGAMVDLALHPAPKKFLVVIKAQPQLGNTAKITRHCNYIWQQISGADRGQFAMVVLEGTGDNPMPDVDLALLRGALQSQGLLISDSASVGFAS